MVDFKTTFFSSRVWIVTSCHLMKHKHLFKRECGEHDCASANLRTCFRKYYSAAENYVMATSFHST